jgi:hypothetical protein
MRSIVCTILPSEGIQRLPGSLSDLRFAEAEPLKIEVASRSCVKCVMFGVRARF